MALRRISITLIILILLALLLIPAGGAFATTGAEPIGLRIERVNTKLPDIKVYLYADNAGTLTEQNIKASLDGQALSVESIKSFRDSGEGTTYIFLADVSTSISNTQMKSMKDALLGFSENLNDIDKMVLLSFGMRVETLLVGGEDKAARENAIDMLVNNQEGTAFYDAISKAILIAGGSSELLPERAVAIAISDGVDYNDGGHTKQEINLALSDGNLPLHAIGLSENNTGRNIELDNFGETARTSGGNILVTGAEGVGEALNETVAAISGCYVLLLKSSRNVIEGDNQALIIEVNTGGRSASVEKELQIREWEPDAVPPEVLGIEQLNDRNGIRIRFSKPLLGAGNSGSYVVTDSGGAAVAIQNVAYTAGADMIFTDVIFADQLYSGEYTLSFIGISDDTMEENPLEGLHSFYFEGEAASLRYFRGFMDNYWWTLAIAAIVVILLIVFRVLRKHKGLIRVNGKLSFGDATEFKHHFETPETVSASLIVTDMKGDAYKVDLEINNSIFVGRSKINNISFDDTKMSRQHFAIEVDQGEYFIMDLQTTNGTFLNGVRISGRRKLENNDVITAGNEKFVFKAGSGV